MSPPVNFYSTTVIPGWLQFSSLGGHWAVITPRVNGITGGDQDAGEHLTLPEAPTMKNCTVLNVDSTELVK